MNIAFITTVDRNPGDAFIRAGIEYLVQQLLPVYRAHYVDKHDVRSLDPNWWYVNEKPTPVRRLLKVWMRIAEKRTEVFDLADVIIQAGTPFYYILPGADGTYQIPSTTAGTDWVQDMWLRRILARGYRAKVVNLAVGTCQPFHSDATEFARSPELLDFVLASVKRASLTTVRDPVGATLMGSLGLPAHLLPCSAIYAVDHLRIFPEPPEFVAMNYMRGGAHYDLGQKIDYDGWERTFLRLYDELGRKHRIVVMCNSASEVIHVRSLIPHADTFFSPRFEDYLHIYARARFGIFNRVHAGVAMSGLGRPAVVIGNDTRARMAELMGLPTYFVNDAGFDRILQDVQSFETDADEWRAKLLQKKETARAEYLRLMSAALADKIEMSGKGEGYRRSDYDKVVIDDRGISRSRN